MNARRGEWENWWRQARSVVDLWIGAGRLVESGASLRISIAALDLDLRY
jgi:hypothetical protein